MAPTEFTLLVKLSDTARQRLAEPANPVSICITQNADKQSDKAPRPVWVSFYKGCPVGINPVNRITWVGAWELDYATRTFEAEGTQITGEGIPSTDEHQLKAASAFGSVLSLNGVGNWENAGKSAAADITVKNNHGSRVSFIYYLKTSVGSHAGVTTGNPVYCSPSLVDVGSMETVKLVQSVNFETRGQHVDNGTVIADTQSQTPTVIPLTGTSTTVFVDFSEDGGWDFSTSIPQLRGLGLGGLLISGQDEVLTLKGDSEKFLDAPVRIGYITGTITVKEAIGVAVAAFVIGSIQLNVDNSGADGGRKWHFSYNGPATLQVLKDTFQNHIANWFANKSETLEARRGRLAATRKQRLEDAENNSF